MVFFFSVSDSKCWNPLTDHDKLRFSSVFSRSFFSHPFFSSLLARNKTLYAQWAYGNHLVRMKLDFYPTIIYFFLKIDAYIYYI